MTARERLLLALAASNLGVAWPSQAALVREIIAGLPKVDERKIRRLAWPIREAVEAVIAEERT